VPKAGCRNSGAGRRIGGKLRGELGTIAGVYTSVFEQSLLLHQDAKRPWNFVASVSAELLIVSLALLIPLLYRDHLPSVHWKDIMVAPAPLPKPFPLVRASGAGIMNQTRSVPRRFIFDLNRPVASQSQSILWNSSIELGVEGPPGLPPVGIGGETNMLGRFIPNVVALLRRLQNPP
jgi:hypothetical protein